MLRANMGFRRALGNSADARMSRAQLTSRRLKSGPAGRADVETPSGPAADRSICLGFGHGLIFLSAARVESS
jgi:hypothetical protein